MHNRRKRPQIKNPFDMDEEEDDQTIPIHQGYNHQTQPKVHNPLPFNPYVIENDTTIKVNNSHKQQAKIMPTQNIQEQPRPFIPVSQPLQRRRPVAEKVYELNEDGDPPLLQDIGIDPEMIKERIKMVLKIGRPTEEMIEDPDLSGPTLIALCFGMLLLFSGKVHFGDIYAIFIVGNIILYFLFNFMSQIQIIPLYNVMSTVGYSLLPMLILGLFGIFLPLRQTSGILLSLGIALWSSVAASNIMQCLMRQTQNDRKPLLIYPLFLFYLSFAMIVIF